MKQRNLSTIIFFEHDGRILLQDRRSITKFGEEWGPFGGSIETGETPDQAIRREVKEELEEFGGGELFGFEADSGEQADEMVALGVEIHTGALNDVFFGHGEFGFFLADGLEA